MTATTKTMSVSPPATLPAMAAVLSEEEIPLPESLRVVGISTKDYEEVSRRGEIKWKAYSGGSPIDG
jgi:hypothetical protein